LCSAGIPGFDTKRRLATPYFVNTTEKSILKRSIVSFLLSKLVRLLSSAKKQEEEL
jgi:hypothetical protein